jgi:ribosomal protein L37E
MVKSRTSSHPTVKRLFQDRKLVIATMHGKELIMRPLIKQYLDVHPECVSGLDTDEFGTFSGEVERPFDPVTTLRKKILKSLQLSGCTLGIGNEGSFGPHPKLPFVQACQEIVMLIDLENDLEIHETIITTETNHAQCEIRTMKDLAEFADRIQFPSHGIILKQLSDDKIVSIRKGILNWEHLYAVGIELRRSNLKIVAETDMRAYLNPTRMKAIERATELLLKKVIRTCPDCQHPGFGPVELQKALTCTQCGLPSRDFGIKVYQCKQCGFTDGRHYNEGHIEPAFCQHCNP